MAPINLSQSYSTEEQPSFQSGKIFDKNFYFAVGLVLLVLAGFAGLKFYNNSMVAESQKLEVYLKGESQGLLNQTADELADFQYRIDSINSDLAQKKLPLSNPDNYLSAVEGMLLPQTKLSKLGVNLEGNSVSFSAVTDSYRSLAMQMAAFRQDKNITSFKLENFSKQDKGMNFSVTATINLPTQDGQ